VLNLGAGTDPALQNWQRHRGYRKFVSMLANQLKGKDGTGRDCWILKRCQSIAARAGWIIDRQ